MYKQVINLLWMYLYYVFNYLVFFKGRFHFTPGHFKIQNTRKFVDVSFFSKHNYQGRAWSTFYTGGWPYVVGVRCTTY